MRRFRINITLENADQKDYSKLNRELKKESFRTIKKNEYGFEGYISLIEVHGALSRAVQRTGKSYVCTVMKEKRVLRN